MSKSERRLSSSGSLRKLSPIFLVLVLQSASGCRLPGNEPNVDVPVTLTAINGHAPIHYCVPKRHLPNSTLALRNSTSLLFSGLALELIRDASGVTKVRLAARPDRQDGTTDPRQTSITLRRMSTDLGAIYSEHTLGQKHHDLPQSSDDLYTLVAKDGSEGSGTLSDRQLFAPVHRDTSNNLMIECPPHDERVVKPGNRLCAIAIDIGPAVRMTVEAPSGDLVFWPQIVDAASKNLAGWRLACNKKVSTTW